MTQVRRRLRGALRSSGNARLSALHRGIYGSGPRGVKPSGFTACELLASARSGGGRVSETSRERGYEPRARDAASRPAHAMPRDEHPRRTECRDRAIEREPVKPSASRIVDMLWAAKRVRRIARIRNAGMTAPTVERALCTKLFGRVDNGKRGMMEYQSSFRSPPAHEFCLSGAGLRNVCVSQSQLTKERNTISDGIEIYITFAAPPIPTKRSDTVLPR